MSAVCPACGKDATEHAGRGQQGFPQPRPHAWKVAGDVDTRTSLWRCLSCGVTVRVPVGARGETLRGYLRPAGECPGLRD